MEAVSNVRIFWVFFQSNYDFYLFNFSHGAMLTKWTILGNRSFPAGANTAFSAQHSPSWLGRFHVVLTVHKYTIKKLQQANEWPHSMFVNCGEAIKVPTFLFIVASTSFAFFCQQNEESYFTGGSCCNYYIWALKTLPDLLQLNNGCCLIKDRVNMLY